MESYFKVIIVGLILSVPACATAPVQTMPKPMQPIITEGQANIINGSVALAKKQALQAAVLKASSQAATPVPIQQDVVSRRSPKNSTHTQILDERVAGNVVKVRAKTTVVPNASCSPMLRKSLVVTAFPLTQSAQIAAAESNDLYRGIPRELNKLLSESPGFIGHDATQIALNAQPQSVIDSLNQAVDVMALAKAHGAQLVLSGAIADMQIESGDYMAGSGPMGMAKSVLHDIWSKRSMGLEVLVQDGLTGATLLKQSYQAIAEGDVWLPANMVVGSAGFKATASGAKIMGLIQRASEDIQHALNCYPFAARITQIDGDSITIEAGSDAKLQVGDQLVVYAEGKKNARPTRGGGYAAYDRQPVGMMTLNAIRAQYAIGYLDVSSVKVGLKVGDWAKSW